MALDAAGVTEREREGDAFGGTHGHGYDAQGGTASSSSVLRAVAGGDGEVG